MSAVEDKENVAAAVAEEQPAEGAHEAAAEPQGLPPKAGLLSAASNFTSRVSTAVSSAAAAAKSKAETLQVQAQAAAAGAKQTAGGLLHAASQRIRRTSEADGHSDAAQDRAASPTPAPPEAVPQQHAEGHSASALASSLLATATEMGKKTKESGSAALHAAVEGIKRLTATRRRVATVCKGELKSKPCPQALLVCSTVIVTKGLSTYGLFRSEARGVEGLLAQLESGMVLPPSDMDPLLAAGVIKAFLSSLEEPLLTRKLADAWVAAADNLDAVPGLLGELPLANLSALRVLADTCYRVAAQFNLTGMNARSLATELAPVMLWHEGTAASAVSKAVSSTGASSAINAGIQALRAKLTRAGAAPAPEAAAAAEADLLAKTEPPAAVEGAESPQQLPASTGKAEGAEHDEDSLSLGEGAEEEEAGAGEGGQGSSEGGAKEAPVVGPRVPLQGQERDALVRVVEHIFISYDDLFAAPVRV